MDTDFLLYNNTAKKLFFEGAADFRLALSSLTQRDL